MANIIFPKRWTEKPPQGTQLNFGHPLASGLTFYLPMAEDGGIPKAILPMGTQPGNVVGTGYPKHGSFPGGRGISFDGNEQLWYERGAWVEPTNAVSLVVRLRRSGTLPSYCRPAGKTYNNDASSPYVSYDIEYNPGGSGQNDVIPSITLGGTLQSGYRVTFPDTTQLHTVAMSYGPNRKGCALFRNGVFQSLNNLSGTISYDQTSTGRMIVGGGSSAGLDNPFKGEIYYVGVWNRELSTPEMEWLHVEPWAMFRPQQPLRKYFFVPPSGTAYFVSFAPQMASFSGTGAKQPQKAIPAATALSVGTVGKRISKSIPASAATFIVSVSKQTAFGILASMAMAGNLTKQYGRSLAGIVALSAASVARQAGKHIVAASAACAGTITRRIAKSQAASMSLSGTLTKQMAKAYAASMVGMAGTIETIRVFLVTFGASMSSMGAAVGRQIGKKIAASQAGLNAITRKATSRANTAASMPPFSATDARNITKMLYGSSVPPAAAIAKQARKSLGATTSAMSASTVKQARKAIASALATFGGFLTAAVPGNHYFVSFAAAMNAMAANLNRQIDKFENAGTATPSGSISRAVALSIDAGMQMSASLAKQTIKEGFQAAMLPFSAAISAGKTAFVTWLLSKFGRNVPKLVGSGIITQQIACLGGNVNGM